MSLKKDVVEMTVEEKLKKITKEEEEEMDNWLWPELEFTEDWEETFKRFGLDIRAILGDERCDELDDALMNNLSAEINMMKRMAYLYGKGEWKDAK